MSRCHPKQSVEEFMAERFEDILNAFKIVSKRKRQRLNDPAEQPESLRRQEALARKLRRFYSIKSVKTGFDTAEVITGPDDETVPGLRIRHHLRAAGDTWKIEFTESECALCLGKEPDPNCAKCHGTGWTSQK